MKRPLAPVLMTEQIFLRICKNTSGFNKKHDFYHCSGILGCFQNPDLIVLVLNQCTTENKKSAHSFKIKKRHLFVLAKDKSLNLTIACIINVICVLLSILFAGKIENFSSQHFSKNGVFLKQTS